MNICNHQGQMNIIFNSRDKILYISQWEKYITFRFSGINPRTDIKILKNPVLRYEYFSNNF